MISEQKPLAHILLMAGLFVQVYLMRHAAACLLLEIDVMNASIKHDRTVQSADERCKFGLQVIRKTKLLHMLTKQSIGTITCSHVTTIPNMHGQIRGLILMILQ